MSIDSKQISPTFCVMPWINLATETNGKCKVCCLVMTSQYVKKSDESDYLLQSDNIEEIWNSTYLKELRNKMLQGQWPADCTYCEKQESLGQISGRYNFNQMWLDNEALRKVILSKDSNGSVEDLPTSLEIRPGILCNLKCKMCWSLSSSKVYSEHKSAVESHQLGKTHVPKFLLDNWTNEVKMADESDFNWSENEIYLNNVEKCLPKLRRIYLTGGEPTLIKSNLVFLKKLIAIKKTDVMISFTTNLQDISEEWLAVLAQFDRVEITGSVDGLGHATEYIRYPSQWNQVSANISKLYNLYPKISFSIVSVIQAANVFDYVDLVTWVAQSFPDRQIQVIPTMLQNPPYLRADILPTVIKEEAISYIDRALEQTNIYDLNKKYLADVRSQISVHNENSELFRSQFKDYISYLDRTRGTDFKLAFPKMAGYRNFCD